MKLIWDMALKNLLRYKRRTALTFLILAVGIAIYIMFTSLLKGFDNQSTENQIQFETGDFKIHSAAYDPDRPYALENNIADPDNILKVVVSKRYVRAATKRVLFSADLDNTVVSTPVIATGVDPEGENAVFQFTNFLVSGQLRNGGAVIGKSLAKDMNADVGDSVYLTFRNAQGTFDSVDLEITGIIVAPNPVVNNSTVFITLSDARKYLNTANVTEIVLKTENYRNYRTYEPDLKSGLPGYKIESWKKIADELMAVGQTKSKAMNLILFFVGIIAAVGIVNTMLMSVYEKRREIGTLKALGMIDRDVRRLFVFEGFLVGMAGSTAGVLLGVLLNIYFVVVGLDLTSMVGNVDIGYRVMGVVKSVWDIQSMVGAFMAGVIISVIASYYPANKTVKMQAMECLRTVQ